MDEKTKQPRRPPIVATSSQMLLQGPVGASIKQATRARPGQPTKRTPAIVEEVLDRISCGEALLNICQDDHLPGYSTFNTWQRNDPQLLEAVDIAYEFHARTMDDMADGILSGGVGSTGDFRRDEARIAHLRYRLGKLNRRRFGEKQQVDVLVNEPFVLESRFLPGQAPMVIDVTPSEDLGEQPGD